MLHRTARTMASRLSTSSIPTTTIMQQCLLLRRPLSSGASLQKAFQNTLKNQSAKPSSSTKVTVNGAAAALDDLATSPPSSPITTTSTPSPIVKPETLSATTTTTAAAKMEVDPSPAPLTPPPLHKPYIPPPMAPLLPRQATHQQPHLHHACQEFAPKITVIGVGGAGGNAVNNMIMRGLTGVEFLVCNTDAQHIATTLTENRLQLGRDITQGLGCGANPDVGKVAGEESKAELLERIGDSHMVFITAGMGGGTGTGAAPIIAQTCLEAGILTVAVVTRPFRFEGAHRMRLAEEGIRRLQDSVDTLIVIPNQNLFKMVDQSTTLLDAFRLADDVLLAGVKGVTDLMTVPGLINLDFADVQSVMSGMGNAIMGTGQASGEDRAERAAEDALKNPLLGEVSIKSAKGMLVNITGGADMTLHEVDKAAQRVTEEVEDETANIIFGSAYDHSMEGSIRVSIVATGIDEIQNK